MKIAEKEVWEGGVSGESVDEERMIQDFGPVRSLSLKSKFGILRSGTAASVSLEIETLMLEPGWQSDFGVEEGMNCLNDGLTCIMHLRRWSSIHHTHTRIVSTRGLLHPSGNHA